MMTKITPVVIAVAAIAGLVVAYSLRTSITPEARRGTPVENEHTKTVLVHSQTDFDEVNSPSVKDVRSANRVLSPVASRPEPRRRPPADEQEEILRNRRVPDTPTREDTQPEVKTTMMRIEVCSKARCLPVAAGQRWSTLSC